MCGIFGILQNPTLEGITGLRDLNLHRGGDSAGYLTLGEPDDQRHLSHKVMDVRIPPDVPPYAGAILGHVRSRTSGPHGEGGIHPFRRYGQYLAMNGMLTSYHTSNELDLEDVDTRHLLWNISDWRDQNPNLPIEQCIKEALTQISGMFACWYVDVRSREIYLFRSMAPIFWHQESQMFSSTPFSEAQLLPEGLIYKYEDEYEDFLPMEIFQEASIYYIPPIEILIPELAPPVKYKGRPKGALGKKNRIQGSHDILQD